MRGDSNVEAPLGALSFEPILKRLIWGGRKLGTVLDKRIGPESDYAESWEIADHRQGRTAVTGGALHGTSLGDLVRTRGRQLLGPASAGVGQFPLLVKFIDAGQTLSVQVHPDDALGRTLANDNGKTEAWVILDAEPGALIYAGLKPGVNRSRFADAMKSGEVEPLLHRFEARPGDCIFIPAGTLHAIGAGVLLAEVQQMSDATFRVHDWGRVGADGRPRDLHPEQALRSIDFDAGAVWPVSTTPVTGGPGVSRESLVKCDQFELERWCLAGPRGALTIGLDDRFRLLIGVAGEVRVCWDGGEASLPRGRTLLVPASVDSVALEAKGGPATVLGASVP